MKVVFPRGQVFIALMRQWKPVLMQGTVESVMHSLLHLHLPWIDVRYELRRYEKPSFLRSLVYRDMDIRAPVFVIGETWCLSLSLK